MKRFKVVFTDCKNREYTYHKEAESKEILKARIKEVAPHMTEEMKYSITEIAEIPNDQDFKVTAIYHGDKKLT